MELALRIHAALDLTFAKGFYDGGSTGQEVVLFLFVLGAGVKRFGDPIPQTV
jgi:hypothetical protein